MSQLIDFEPPRPRETPPSAGPTGPAESGGPSGPVGRPHLGLPPGLETGEDPSRGDTAGMTAWHETVGAAGPRFGLPPRRSVPSLPDRLLAPLGGLRRLGRTVVPGGLAPLAGAVRSFFGRPGALAPLAGRRLLAAVKDVTGAGWTLLGLGVLAWVAAAWWGWEEASVVAVFCLLVVLVGSLFTIGRTRVEVALRVDPDRVFAGQVSMASFEMTNRSGRRQGSVRVRLPVGQSAAHYTSPTLAPGQSWGDWVSVPSRRRGVVPVGPVVTYRGDPLGLVRREVAWTEPIDLVIHPRVVALPEIGRGLLRDLEGRSTPEVSTSDLAFHALRDYLPGDDRRHIHWKSSARLSTVTGEDRFMVRQFLDTRRNHIGVVSDLAGDHFAEEDEFELALSVAASIAVGAMMDQMDLSLVCGDQVIRLPRSNRALDAYSRAQLGERPLPEEFERFREVVPDASTAVVVTGSGVGLAELERGRTIVSPAVPLLAVRVALGSPICLRQAGGLVELTVGALEDLPRALAGGGLA